MMRRIPFAVAFCIAMIAGTTRAQADEENGYTKDDWPLATVNRPLILPKGMFEARGDTLRINLSEDQFFEPISLAPDFYYGIKDGWNLGITHDTGICLTGTSGGCQRAYNDVGVQLQLRLMGRGSFQLTAVGGARVINFADPFVAGLDFGFRGRIRAGKIAIVSRPSIYVGLAERDMFPDLLDIPVDLLYQLQPQLALSLETGVAGTLDAFGDTYKIPVGLAALFALNERMDVGGALRFTNLAGSGGGVDGRELVGRFALRL